MSTNTTDEQLWEMVRGSRNGILATLGDDGFPHLTNVNFLAEESESDRSILVTTTAGRVKGKNILRDPKVSLHVAGQDWFHFAVVEGLATAAVATTVGDAATDELDRIFTAFRGPQARPAFDESMIAKRRMSVRIPVTRLYGLIPPPGAGR